jgi:hypothetical protein
MSGIWPVVMLSTGKPAVQEGILVWYNGPPVHRRVQDVHGVLSLYLETVESRILEILRNPICPVATRTWSEDDPRRTRLGEAENRVSLPA